MPVLSKHSKWLQERSKFSEFEPILDESNKRVFIHVAFDDFSSDTIITWKYFKKWIRKNRTTLKQRFENAAKLIDHFDEVPKEIIGKFDVSQAFKRAPDFAKWIIRFSLPDDHKEFNSLNNDDLKKGVVQRDEKTASEIVERKKVPSGIINKLVAEAVLTALVHDNKQQQNRDTAVTQDGNPINNNTNLYVTDHHLTNEWKEQCKKNNIMPKGDVSIFVVDKSTLHADGTPVQRIITDARFANAQLKNPAQMELFTLEALLQRMATITKDDQRIFALACDLRHWFHQIPLPRRYRRYLRIKLNDTFVYPSCWPMGFHMSPAVAQACTWTILLADLDQDSEEARRKKKALGIPPHMRFNEYVQWLPLEDGGGVFVLIDNIFIITKSERIRETWKKRIETNTRDLGATLKEVKSSSSSSTPTPTTQKIFFEEKMLTKRSNETINFSGIEFSATGRRTVEEIDKIDQLDNNNNNNIWSGSYRDLASILGQCMWTYRVRGIRLLALEDLLDLYSAKAFPRENISWDTQITITNDGDVKYFDILRKHYDQCRNQRDFVAYDQIHEQNSWAFIASDAALKQKEEYKNNNNIHNTSKQEENFIGGLLLHPKDNNLETNPQRISLIFKEEHNEEGIALAELKAVVVSVRKMLELYPNDPPDVYMIALDSMAAKGMISRGFSRVPRARELLKELFGMVGNRKIFLMYVESEKNPADAPSRNEVWVKIFNVPQQQKWSDVLSRLEENKIFASTVSTKNGKQVTQPLQPLRRTREIQTM